ncbi:peptidyl-tRNA hydrolase [bacterium]|nr:peptidyl-tRNA hydrolase [bacterium]
MKLIVGLGNVGRQYKDTPHNAGFELVNAFRTAIGNAGYIVTEWKNEKIFEADLCKAHKDGELEFFLLKPNTFMNHSGRSIEKLTSKYRFTEVVIVHDDLDILLGEYKIQVGKAPRDHNGVNSIEHIKGQEKFLRVRVGVESRNSGSKVPGDIYVLKKLDKDKIEILSKTIDQAVQELFTRITAG